MTITAECFTGIAQIIGCTWSEAFGGTVLASLFGLILFAYILYRAGFNMIVAIPLAFMALFALYWITFEAIIFQTLMLLVMFIGAAILGFALWRYFKR